MRKLNPRSLLAALLLFGLLLTELPVQAQPSRNSTNRITNSSATPSGTLRLRPPKLVVLLVVDQFRYDFLERFADLFSAGGFRRLMKDGALFTNANYEYLPTYTAPGHAAIATGSVPAYNGIVGNLWFDREANKMRVMVSDDNARLVTGKGVRETPGSFSPRILIGTTISDQLRLANSFQSKVVSLSFKDRSAILSGGQRPNSVYWFSASTGEFVTSDYYTKELPAWVKQFNDKQKPDQYFGAKWERSLPAEAYARAQTTNLALQRSSVGNQFPYTVTGGETAPGARFYDAFQFTPFGSEHLANFAKAAIENEELGKDNYPDLLSVSFSSPDLTGHAFGPDSQEVLDVYCRLDKTLADFLLYLDKKVGLANTLIAVSGDHGVCPVPEYLTQLGLDAARLSDKPIREAVNQALAERFNDDKLVQAFVNDQFYLDRKRMADKRLPVSEVERVVGEAALTIPGIVRYFTRTQILDGRLPNDPIARRVAGGFHRQRSGDVWLITKPFSFIAEGALATTHGSPYNYDTHVPIILFGAQVRRGRYHIECSPSDIAPTLAAMLGIEMPNLRTGRVLAEALVESK